MMTTTDELFLPSRIIYKIFDHRQLLARFRQLRCMTDESVKGRWTWNYEFEALNFGFPRAYDEIPPERRPVVLAACYFVKPDRLHVIVRSTLRLTKSLVFFDQQIPRTCARGEFMDEYNLVTVQDPRKPLTTPEDFFRDETKIVFADAEAAPADPAQVADLLRRHRERYLEPLERHRLTAFYEDGEKHMEMAMRLREVLAMKQHQSEKTIRPFDVIMEAVGKSGEDLSGGFESLRADPKPASTPASAVRENQPEAADEDEAFSFLRWDPKIECEVFEITPTSGPRERYGVSFNCCDNPICDCQVLDAWFESLQKAGPVGPGHHLRLNLESKTVTCGTPEGPTSSRLAHELANRMSSEDWVQAERLYRSEKAEFSELTDIAEFDLPFPDEVLADPGVLVQYQEVFPLSWNLQFETAGGLWVVLERYCSNPACACQEVFLSIVSVPRDATRRTVGEKDVTQLQFDYARDSVKVLKNGPPGSPPPLELFAALRAAQPDLEERLRRRNRVLRQAHHQARPSQARLTTPNPVRAETKVGRNDPCPCGSGKKFKKCCGG